MRQTAGTPDKDLKMAATGTEAMNPPAKKYGAVVITLDNVLLPPEKLSPSPSQQDGLDAEIEMDLRILGCELIQTGGILLRLPQVSTMLVEYFAFFMDFIGFRRAVEECCDVQGCARVEG